MKFEIEKLNYREKKEAQKQVADGLVTLEALEQAKAISYKELCILLGTMKRLSAKEERNKGRIFGDVFYDGITANGEPFDQ